ncbi:RNA exonuclease 1, partial [Orchesella cincta]
IRIDRKIEAETLDESASTNEKTSSPPSQTNEGAQHPSINKTPVSEGSKEVITTVESPSNNNKSEPEINTELENTRLKTPQNLNVNKSVDNHRKRSRDSEGEDPLKRRRLSVEVGEMGQVLSLRLPGILEKEAPKPEPPPETHKRDRHKKDELDLLVEEIEKAGRISPKSKKHRKHKHKSRHSDGSNTPESTTTSESSSPRKEDKSKHDSHKKKDEKVKDSSSKDSKDPKKDHSKRDDHKRRKDSKESSSSKSHKDSKRPRESSSSSSSHRDRSSHKSKESSETRKSTDRRSSNSSGSEKSQKPSTTSKEAVAIPNNVDTINRFSALAENLLDESAYISDTAEQDDSFDFAYPSDSEDDPEMVARECLEMFENYQPELDPAPVQSNDNNDKKEDPGGEFMLVGKKRVAHANAIMKPPAASPPKRPVATSIRLQETLVKRLEDQTKCSTKPSNGVTSLTTAPTRAPVPAPGKMRIAHVPNAGKLAHKPAHLSSSKSSKPTVGSSTLPNHSKISSDKPGTPGSLTYSQTAAKGVKRQAHQPTVTSTKPGPMVYRDAINKTTKIPHVTRQHIMDKMFEEYYKVLGNYEVAFETTVNRENELVGRCSTKPVYLSSGTSIISGLRKSNRGENEQINGGSSKVMAHAHILSGGSLESRNCSVRVAKKDTTLPKGNRLYKALRQYVATERQLVDNGYPRPHPSGEPGRAVAKPRQGEENAMSLTRRICDRCKRRYETNPEGDHIVLEVCNYHWGRKYNVKGFLEYSYSTFGVISQWIYDQYLYMFEAKGGRGARECSFSCCGGDDDTIGCVTAVCHVSKCPVPISSQKGFVEAVLEEGPEDEMGNNPWDIIGIDCEMVYTTHGNELARVTVVGAELQVLYDEIVRTTHRVLDVNTRFSGITFEDMDRAKRGITEIQSILLSHIRPNTIIIGHSLESDLLALHIKHECVIDTTILYPHRLGPPKKRALKNISVEVLKKVIQEHETGHDSAEDAQIAFELVLAKLKSDIASK